MDSSPRQHPCSTFFPRVMPHTGRRLSVAIGLLSPAGTRENSPAIYRWVLRAHDASPAGTEEAFQFRQSRCGKRRLLPSLTGLILRRAKPTDESVGLFPSSLR